MDSLWRAAVAATVSLALVCTGVVGWAPAANAEGYGGRVDLDAFQESVDVLDDGSEVLVSGIYQSIFRVSVASGEFTEVSAGATTVVRSSPTSDVAYLGRSGWVARLALSGDHANEIVSETQIDGSVTDVAFDGLYAYVASFTLQGSGGVVTKIEQATGNAVASIPVGDKPTSITIDPVSHHAFTTNRLDATVSDIDLADFEVKHTVELALGSIVDAAVDTTNDRLYLADEGGSIKVVKLSTLEVLEGTNLPCNARNVEIATAPTGRRLFVACNALPKILRINLEDMAIEESLDIRSYADVAEMAITPDGTRAYIANDGGRSMPFFSLVGSGLLPAIGAASSTSDGFTATITNYDPAYQWSASVTGGGAAVVDANGVLRVTGLRPGLDVTATVTTSRTGYHTREATKLGRSATGQAKRPTFADPVPTANGFTVQVMNFDSDFAWTTSDNAEIDEHGLVTVTGLDPGETAIVTVSTTREGYANGFELVSGTAATHAGLTPTFVNETPFASGYTVVVENYDPNYLWQVTGSDGFAEISHDGIVTAYAQPGNENTVTVTTSRTGYESVSQTYTGTAGAAPASAPTDVTASPRTGSVVLDWTAPEQYGIYPTTGYRVSQATSADGPFAPAGAGCAAATTETSTETSCQVTGLQNGTTYYFRVVGINIAGDGAASEPVGVTPRNYAVAVSVPAQTALGQVITASVRVTPTGVAAGAVTGSARVYRNNVLFCTAAIRSGAGSCSAVIPNRSGQRWTSTFTQSGGGDWASPGTAAPASQTLTIDRIAVKSGSCPRRLTANGFISSGASRVTMSVLARGRWVSVAPATTRTRSWTGAVIVPAAGTAVRATDGRTTTGAIALPSSTCRR